MQRIFNNVSVESNNPKLSRNGHRQRMREVYLAGGMQNAPDHNLLELIFVNYNSSKGC